MSGCEAKVPALRFRMSHAEAQRRGEGGCVSSSAECRARNPAVPWVKKRLGDFGKPFNGLNGKTKADFGHGEGRYVTYLGIFSNPIVGRESCAPIEVDTSQNEVKRGDVFFTTSSETPDEVGMSAVWLDDAANTYLNSFCFGFRPNGDNDSEFLAYLFRSLRFRDDMAFLAQGISRYNISKGRVMNISVALPSDSDEQRRIGSFFRLLDALIAGREKALEKLEALKKSMLLKMFPQGDATVPEVRFKGFAGDWEKKRLGDSFNLEVSTNTLSRAELSQTGMVRNVHYGDVLIKYGSIVDVSNEAIPFIADCQFKCDRKNKLMDGDVIMADTAEDETAGKVTEIRGIGDKLLVSGLHTIVLRPNEKYGDGFLGYCLNAPGYHESLSSVMQGAKVLSINKGVLSDTDFLAPSLPEQQKIGAYFRSLDALLASRREEIGKLQQMKKALLERMFV